MLHTISFLQRIMSKSTADCVMRWSSKSILFFVRKHPITTLKVCAQCVTSMCQNSRVFLLVLTNILLADKQKALKIDIDEMYSNLVQLEEEGKPSVDEVGKMDTMKEDFWREMEHADDPFETMCFYISKGYLDL